MLTQLSLMNFQIIINSLISGMLLHIICFIVLMKILIQMQDVCKTVNIASTIHNYFTPKLEFM
jgi:hypothetical protein